MSVICVTRNSSSSSSRLCSHYAGFSIINDTLPLNRLPLNKAVESSCNYPKFMLDRLLWGDWRQGRGSFLQILLVWGHFGGKAEVSCYNREVLVFFSEDADATPSPLRPDTQIRQQVFRQGVVTSRKRGNARSAHHIYPLEAACGSGWR